MLVEPAGPLNVGSVARLCANYGLGGLRLVAPRCDPLAEEARRMAVHGRAVLEAALIFPTLAAALADCRRVVACSGRLEGPPLPLEDPVTALGWLLEAPGSAPAPSEPAALPSAAGDSLDPPHRDPGRDPGSPARSRMGLATTDQPPADHLARHGRDARRQVRSDALKASDAVQPGGADRSGSADSGEIHAPAALVFGREDRGLSNDELLQAGRLLTLATDPGYPSLNLSHAVAVVLHELHGLHRGRPAEREHGASVGLCPAEFRSPAAGLEEPEPCARGELEAALSDAEALLLEVGFLLPHTAQARMAKLRTLLQRARIRSPEVALLRGMVAQLRWASRRSTSAGPTP